MYDATFGLQKADSFTLHSQVTGNASYIRGQAGNPVFDDTKQYWFTDSTVMNRHGVDLPEVGVEIRVLEQTATTVKIHIS